MGGALRSGEPQALGGRAFDLLLALIERRGEVLSKDELMRQVWPGQCQPRHTDVEWLKFLRQIERATPKGKTLHLIADNCARRKHRNEVSGRVSRPAHRRHATCA